MRFVPAGCVLLRGAAGMIQRIIRGRYPPNFSVIKARFPNATDKGTIFSYGDLIYLPAGGNLSRELIAHEAVHGERQMAIGVELWWDKYATERNFVLEEELLAHRAEYLAYRAGRNGRSRAGHLHVVAERLSGPLYRLPITYQEAVRLITEWRTDVKEAA